MEIISQQNLNVAEKAKLIELWNNAYLKHLTYTKLEEFESSCITLSIFNHFPLF